MTAGVLDGTELAEAVEVEVSVGLALGVGLLEWEAPEGRGLLLADDPSTDWVAIGENETKDTCDETVT